MTKTILILAIAAALVAGTITTTALVYAHGGDGSLIHACVSKSTGATRIVGDFVTCKSSENSVDWPKTAVPGPQGTQGEQGIQGEQGVQGPAGTGTTFYATNFIHKTDCVVGGGGCSVDIDCDVGDVAINAEFTAGSSRLITSLQLDSDTWRVSAILLDDNGAGIDVQAAAICADNNPPHT